jgi:prohibitin 1
MNRVFKFKAGCVALVAVPILGFLFYNVSAHWIPAGSVGLVYNASGGLDSHVYRPQRLFLTPWQRLYTYPTKIQAAIYTSDPAYGENKSADGILVTTSDNAQTTYDVIVYYRVTPDTVMQAFKSFGPIPIEDIQSQHIRRFVKEAVNAVGTEYDVFALMGAKRREACEKVQARLIRELSPRGIDIEHVFLVSPEPVGEVNSKIAARVNAYTQLATSKLRSQIATLDSTIAVLRGQTEARARSIVAGSTNAQSIVMQKLELAEQAVDAWDGTLPPIQPKGNQTIIVNGTGSDVATVAPRGVNNGRR